MVSRKNGTKPRKPDLPYKDPLSQKVCETKIGPSPGGSHDVTTIHHIITVCPLEWTEKVLAH